MVVFSAEIIARAGWSSVVYVMTNTIPRVTPDSGERGSVQGAEFERVLETDQHVVKIE